MAYTLDQFKEKYDRGGFKIDLKGHICSNELRNDLKSYLTYSLKIDGLDDVPSIGNIEVGKPLPISLVSGIVKFKCLFQCGETFVLGLIDEDTLSVFRKIDNEYIHDYKCKCEYSTPIPNVEVLKFDDEIIFTNRFPNSKDAPEYSPE